MRCAEFEAQLQQTLDRRMAPEADHRLVQHAEHCESCRRVLDTQQLLMEGLREIEAPRERHVGHQVLDRLVAERTKRTRRLRLVVALAISAAVLAMVLPFAQGPGDETTKTRSNAPGLAIATIPKPPQVEPAMSPKEAEEFRLLIRQLVDQVSKQPLEGLHSVDQVAGRSIRPLAATLHFAFDTLRRTLPGQDSAESGQPQALFVPADAGKTIT